MMGDERMAEIVAAEERCRQAAEASPVRLLKQNLVYAIACAPKELTGEQVAAAANEQTPWDLFSSTLRWVVSEKTFEDEETNPAGCSEEPDARQHWLLNC